VRVCIPEHLQAVNVNIVWRPRPKRFVAHHVALVASAAWSRLPGDVPPFVLPLEQTFEASQSLHQHAACHAVFSRMFPHQAADCSSSSSSWPAAVSKLFCAPTFQATSLFGLCLCDHLQSFSTQTDTAGRLHGTLATILFKFLSLRSSFVIPTIVVTNSTCIIHGLCVCTENRRR
jgi:hypothetical protein